jgi:Uma2 family endonuclease
MSPLTLPLKVDLTNIPFSDDQFYQLCINNPDLNVECDANGALVLMSPVGGESGSREAELSADLIFWNRRTQLGRVFSSSTIFCLPNGGRRSPDAAWIELSRWQKLTPQQRRKFPPIAPDFVMELRSQSDRLETLHEKMQEYMDSGVRLGWLINPQEQQVEIYREGQDKEVKSLPAELSGETVLPGFVLQFDRFVDE